MLRNHGWLTLVTLTTISILGCTKPEGTATQSVASQDRDIRSKASTNKPTSLTNLEAPAVTCYEFLEALRMGNDEKATKLLSTAAQEKAAALNRNITPPASDTARFTIGKVNYIGEDGARVGSTWTDVDEEGQSHSDEAIWVLRHEQQGWRIVGVAAIIFTGESPLLLNFEDPEDMVKKQQWVREEIRRRAEKESVQAKEQDNSENSMRR